MGVHGMKRNKQTLYTQEGGGHYLLTETEDTIELSRYQHDPTWCSPGEVVCKFDKNDFSLELLPEGSVLDISTVVEVGIIYDYLKAKCGWITSYEKWSS